MVSPLELKGAENPTPVNEIRAVSSGQQPKEQPYCMSAASGSAPYLA
jgi:hypothetical protein